MSTALDAVSAAFRHFSVRQWLSSSTDLHLEHPSIKTYHKTYVCYNHETSTIEHVEPSTLMFLNRLSLLYLVIENDSAFLQAGRWGHVAEVDFDGKATLEKDKNSTSKQRFTLGRHQDTEESLFSMTKDGLFLCAEDDGRITISRHHASLWELFSTSTISPIWTDTPGELVS